ncbi:MAG: hypothetical protein K0U37_08750, partial [Gammaproteobacteria bacterium]|nr:hypothetical protein [Gammaproteobacteria bacterium]
MVKRIDQIDVDLRSCPEPYSGLPITQATMGDLHANAIKLIYNLIRSGVCKIEPEDYAMLVRIYESGPPLSKAN